MSRRQMNLAQSKRLGKLVGAESGACWWNAMEALRWLQAEGREGAVYVEGWAVSRFDMVVEHGWVEYRGRVIDPTPSWWDSANEARYFPGLRFTLDELDAEAETYPDPDGLGDPHLPVAWRIGGWGGFKSEPYRAALDDAYRAVYGQTLTEMHQRIDRAEQAIGGAQ